ncbi:trehalase family glycosidase [Coraliomargarita sp. SDUM461004]|uniref:Trehalase family glycosidase n=1 Tax=Thalassobacterium sedimentorum TaxID=3041258 RepID=A0ABU1AG41_9BACT|nr:trehalase family glycosidase [Coraliomargarita sp. SDUM461004]MDQ8193694.1 trehalase family glycosidase [Coraliomargarita sp. SDUM461004]
MNESSIQQRVKDYISANWDATVVEKSELLGAIPLPEKYTVPTMGPTFRAFFYWDTYFTCEGLILEGRLDLALSNANNFIHLCNTLGYIPNFNIEGHLNRSQLPVAAMLYEAVYKQTGDKAWLAEAFEALQIEYSYWMGMRIGPDGLNRHYTHASPVEIDQFYDVVKDRLNDIPEDRSERRRYLAAAIAEAENWDFTPRYDRRCPDFYAVDLNALVLSMEEIAGDFASELGEDAEVWRARAAQRRMLCDEFLWNESQGLYFDYDWARREQGSVVTASNYYALACGLPSADQAAAIFEAADGVLELACGVSTGADQGLCPEQIYQWDYPNAWPPIQFLAMKGALRYGRPDIAEGIARKYTDTIELNFERSGQLWEKYNAVTGGIDVSDEYPMPPMMGWTSGVYLYACSILDASS